MTEYMKDMIDTDWEEEISKSEIKKEIRETMDMISKKVDHMKEEL